MHHASASRSFRLAAACVPAALLALPGFAQGQVQAQTKGQVRTQPQAQPQAQPQVHSPAPADASRETLGPGDTVRITVFQNPDLTTEARLSERGTIVFPLVGEIALGGRTPTDAGTHIADRLKQGQLVKTPQVNVGVMQVRSRQVSVLGHVVKPGRYALDDASSRITDLLALAGGIAATGDDVVTVVLTRGDKVTRHEIDVPAMYR